MKTAAEITVISTITDWAVIEQTCFVVAESDGGERDQSIVDTVAERPVFQLPKYESRNDGEEYEKDGEGDEHSGQVLANRPHSSVVVRSLHVARSQEASVKRSIEPTADRRQRHQL